MADVVIVLVRAQNSHRSVMVNFGIQVRHVGCPSLHELA